MTKEEPWVPQVGEIVEIAHKRTWMRAIVVPKPRWMLSEHWAWSRGMIYVRRLDKTRAGHSHGPILRRPDQIRRVQHLNPVTANVYADWLDEHDQPEAAALLREAFPLENGR